MGVNSTDWLISGVPCGIVVTTAAVVTLLCFDLSWEAQGAGSSGQGLLPRFVHTDHRFRMIQFESEFNHLRRRLQSTYYLCRRFYLRLLRSLWSYARRGPNRHHLCDASASREGVGYADSSYCGPEIGCTMGES